MTSFKLLYDTIVVRYGNSSFMGISNGYPYQCSFDNAKKFYSMDSVVSYITQFPNDDFEILPIKTIICEIDDTKIKTIDRTIEPRKQKEILQDQLAAIDIELKTS